jgi:site-specific DNA-methyltransferase (adenine-specific)
VTQAMPEPTPPSPTPPSPTPPSPTLKKEPWKLRFGDRVEMINVKDIDMMSRSRKDFSKIPELVKSIESKGLIHPPCVTQHPEASSGFKWKLVAGECRIRSMLMLGVAIIPCIPRDRLTPLEAVEMELEENVSRNALSWDEHCELMLRIHTLRQAANPVQPGKAGSTGWTVEDTGNHFGVSKGLASKQIAFAKKLRERPDLKAKVKALPISAAMRVVEQTIEKEEVDRRVKAGELKLSSHLWEGDCRNLFAKLDKDSVDLVVCDPPFGIGTIDDLEGESRGTSMSYTAQLSPDDNSNLNSVIDLITTIAPQLERVLKPGSHFYIFHSFNIYDCLVSNLRLAGLECSSCPLIWYKGRTTAPFRGYEYSPCFEPILFGWKPPKTRRLTDASSMLLEFSPVSAKDKLHPFEKPQELLSFLIQQSSNKGELVLDFCAGSGSTVVAAQTCGRSAIGFEKNHEHILKAQNRLEALRLEGEKK